MVGGLWAAMGRGARTGMTNETRRWLEGALLLGVYLILAIAFFFLPGEAGEAAEHSRNVIPFLF